MIHFFLLLLTSQFLFVYPTMAEVQQVTLKYQPGLCNDQCARFIVDTLSRTRGVQNVTMVGKNDAASIQYNSNQRFSWFSFDRAMRTVGISIQETQIKVRGEIRSNGRKFTLISIGDGTPFNLLGPLNIQPGKYVTSNNPMTHQPNAELRSILLDGMYQKKIAVIQGPLLMPWSNPVPLNLIVQQISWE